MKNNDTAGEALDLNKLADECESIALWLADAMKPKSAAKIRELIALARAGIAADAEQAEPVCQMGEHACSNAAQCWEPCGHLGKSAEHAAPVSAAPAGQKDDTDKLLLEECRRDRDAARARCAELELLAAPAAPTANWPKPDTLKDILEWIESMSDDQPIKNIARAGLKALAAPAAAQDEPSKQDAKVPGIAYPTTYADLARLTPEQLWNRWRSIGWTIDAKEAFIAARRIPFAAPIPQKEGAGEVDAKPLAYGHREDFYLMANARRLAESSIAEIKSTPNWVFAKQLFATGSASAHQICADAGIDPDGYKVVRAAQPKDTTDTKEKA